MLAPAHADNPTTNPLVSMIVTSYNHARFILETLESVKAQTYRNTELIIVDDCSSDDSVAIIERWLHENKVQCTLIPHQKNQGICKSLNEALTLTTGKYISMIASDDVWLPDKIEHQVGIMESQPETVGVVYSDAFQMDENGHPLTGRLIASCRDLPERPQGQILSSLLEGNFIGGQTALIRRNCYDKVGLYDESLPWEDWDMWMRMARHYSFLYSPTPSVKYRVHEKSFSHSDPARMLKDSFRICLKQLGLGDLTEDQRATLTGTLLKQAEHLYGRNDPWASGALLALWQATGNKRARWMYWFSRFGVPFRSLQRANSCRIKLGGFLSGSARVNDH